jgi:FHA domain
VYRMQSALDARNRGQLAGLFTDLPPRRPGPRKLMARIWAALRGQDTAARDARPDGDHGIPRTQQVVRPAYQGPWGLPGGEGAAPLPAAPADPAPFVFPPGSGVRFTIGRTRECDLCLSDLSVSRMHALLVHREDGWVLSDLGSHNGTRLNGWLVREPVPVHPGDRVEFGSMAFIIQAEPPPPLPAAREEEPGPGA